MSLKDEVIALLDEEGKKKLEELLEEVYNEGSDDGYELRSVEDE